MYRGRVAIQAIVLLGPTASGKTDLALRLAERSYEIVSADSVQVYRYLDIGSGKPTKEQQGDIPHHCIDLIDPDGQFTAGDFCRSAEAACDCIRAAGRIPFFVGGTGLYIDSFFQGLSEIPAIDRSVRSSLLDDLEKRGLQCLYEELHRLDPVFAHRIHAHDRQRILRGLEVVRSTGQPISYFYHSVKGHESDAVLYLGIRVERNDLYNRIDARVDRMMASGLLDEVRQIRERFGAGLNSLRSIGYSQISEHCDGKISLQAAVENIKLETRRYAKRQMTWFRKNGRVIWIEPGDIMAARAAIRIWRQE